MFDIKNKKIIDQIKNEMLKSNEHISNQGNEFYFVLMLAGIDNYITQIKQFQALKRHWKNQIQPHKINTLKKRIERSKKRIEQNKQQYKNERLALPQNLSASFSYNDLMVYDKIRKYNEESEEKIFNLQNEIDELEDELQFYKTTTKIYTKNHKRQLIEIENINIEKIRNKILTQLNEQGLTDIGRIKINEILGNLGKEEDLEDEFKIES